MSMWLNKDGPGYIQAINKDTVLCMSIAKTAGSTGCAIHNYAFKKCGLNFVYKSFSTNDVKGAMDAMRTLGIRGCGVTMPHKIDVLKYVNELSDEVIEIGSANTIVNNNGHLTAYNTDVYSSSCILSDVKDKDKIYILGAGGFSKAVQYSAKKYFKNIEIITRDNWDVIDKIEKGTIFNCTPVDNIHPHKDVNFIDCIVTTTTGKRLAILQASKQFELYTGSDFPIDDIMTNYNDILNEVSQ